MSQSRNPRRARLSTPSLAGDRRSRAGLIVSVMLHAAVIAATLFSWQHSLEIADQAPPIVPVELVTIGEKTNIKAESPEPDKFAPKDETPVEAPKVSEQTPAAPEEAAPPKVEMAEQKPEPAPPPPKQAASEPVIQKKPPPAVPIAKPRPAEPDKKQAKFDVNNILALLDKKEPSARTSSKGAKGEHARKGVGDQNAMTMDLQDAMLNQIRPCWSPPVGAPNAGKLIVEFEVFLNPDGSVARPPQLTGQSGDGSYIRAAAEAARRAIYTCAPYKLPADRYSLWRDITMTFDPSKMVGQ